MTRIMLQMHGDFWRVPNAGDCQVVADRQEWAINGWPFLVTVRDLMLAGF